MLSSLGFSLRVDGDSDVSRSNFKDWWTRLSGMYVFCKHLGAASTCGTDKSPASAMCFVIVRREGLSRIALRKYTSFGVHLAVKHFGARPGMHPNIDRFSVHTGSGGMEWPGLLVQSETFFEQMLLLKRSLGHYVWPGIKANRRLRTVYRAVQLFRR